ncbi:MAG: DNA-3-methyladenine glycosylase 2 family protein [Bacteroidetes bacterium]|jgi:DNA-3-methyladenine glycosylase II|nr:DNA-3-methyladenine glycosylase 2 family protein [Bacteroidota bacterium]
MAAVSKQLEHLNKDKQLKKAIKQIGTLKLSKNDDLYFALMRSIVSQQLSVKAADTIFRRFLELFKDGYPHPKQVLKMKDEKLRSAGLSFQKAGYLKNIAQFSIDKTLDYHELKSKPDDELIEYLVEIKGVGRWTVEMILMFSLGRPDVFPKDDLGIQNGIKKLYNINPSNKKELYNQMDTIAERWKPYRTLACMYLWRYKDDF